MKDVTVVCLSHFGKTAAKSLTLEMKLSPPLLTISTWKDTLSLARPNHGFSVLEGHLRSSGPIYSQGSREKLCELVTELRGRVGPR